MQLEFLDILYTGHILCWDISCLKQGNQKFNHVDSLKGYINSLKICVLEATKSQYLLVSCQK
jgi:hypothetical protein